MVLWKRLNTESGPKKRKPPQNEFFPVFSKIIGNPSNPIFRGISRFFYPFPRFLGRIPVYQGLILLRDFPIFSMRFLIFWVRFRFSEKVLNSQFVYRFPLFLGPFPIFRKSCKFSVCWPVSSFFGSVSGLLKKF